MSELDQVSQASREAKHVVIHHRATSVRRDILEHLFMVRSKAEGLKKLVTDGPVPHGTVGPGEGEVKNSKDDIITLAELLETLPEFLQMLADQVAKEAELIDKSLDELREALF